MMSPIRNRFTRVFFLAAGVLLVGLLCTKKKNPVSSGDDDPEEHIPSITIITPDDDSTFESGTDSVTITAYIKNSDYIDSVTVNGKKVSVLEIDDDTLTVKLALDDDTTTFTVAVYYDKSKSLSDDIVVYRTEEVPEITTGMAKISGTLLKEAPEGVGKRLAKPLVAMNAQGLKAEVENVIPVSGADIMLYDAEALSTSSDTTVQTDSTGKWSVELEPGNYFVFAVYFDRENLEIVTSALPDIKAEEEKETVTDSAIAVSDDISPMLLTFCDAAEANDDNMFLGSEIPVGLPIVMSFSEPMTRVSAGEATTGIVLGPVDSDDNDLLLTDTLDVKKLWGPNGKELRLIPENDLEAGKTYKVVIPSSCKDLALNKLDNSYSGIFTVIEADELPDFALKSTAPADEDTIPPGFPVEFIFTRPIDVLSLNKEYSVSSEDDESIEGFFEVKGNVARFINKHEWVPGAEYTITINGEVKDLLEAELGSDAKLTFVVQPKDEFEQKEGIEGIVASAVKKFLGAYIAGDLESFAQSFHQAFELIETSPEGEEQRLQLSTFLDQMRAEIEERNRLSKFGIIAPVFHYPTVDGNRYVCWKLAKGDVEIFFEDMGEAGGIGKVPRIISTDNEDITDEVTYVDRGIVYNGETLYFAPPDQAFIDKDARENDPSFFGKLLRDQTDVETQEIMLTIRNDFIIRNLEAEEGNDTAQVMIELITEEQYLDGKMPFPIENPDDPPPAVQKHVTALQTKMVFASGKWMVLQIAAKELYSGDKEAFNEEDIEADDFVIQEFEQTRGIEFVNPAHKSAGVETPIKLEWKVTKNDGINGYLVAIANELSGGNEGLLIFTTKTSVTLNENGSVDADAKILSVDPTTLHVPLPMFNARLTSFAVNDSDVYIWKVIGLEDSTASAIKANTMLHILADSDFGSHGGIGIFTLLDEMPDISMDLNQFNPEAQPMEDMFADRDGDFFPDWIERAYGTSPDDAGSRPNFTIDSDNDGYPDFMEEFAGSDPEDETSKPEDSNPGPDNIADQLQARPEWDPILNMDDDGDGFPNEIEMLFGTDPWNGDSKPSKSLKPSVPVNTYYGGIKTDDGVWKKINFSLISDTTGNFAYIDTTELQGIARGGVDLSVKLLWGGGEWVFYLEVVEGPNTGRFIKVRFTRQGNELRGPVDLADMVGGGGPYIGEFFASTDSMVDLNSIGGGDPTNPIDNPDPQGELHLGPPPPERMERPAENADDMQLVLTFPESGDIGVEAVFEDGSITFEPPFWSPGQYPSLGCNQPGPAFDGKIKNFHLEGDLYKTEDGTLALVGFFECDVQEDEAGGFIHERFDFTVTIADVDDPHGPSGTWNGWHVNLDEPTMMGPNPFIGTKDSVDAALERTSNMGIIMDSDETVTIDSASQDPNMNVWIAFAGDGKYYIMEVMGDFASVQIKDIDGTPYIVLSGEGGGIMMPMPFFSGDRETIMAALSESSLQVKVNDPNNSIITVDTSTLHTETLEGNSEPSWVINEDGTDRTVVFTAQDDDVTVLRFEDEMPLVMDFGMGPGMDMVPFNGDSALIVEALEASGNMVMPADAPQPTPIPVAPNTLMWAQETGKPEHQGWVVQEDGNEANLFVFIGLMDNPGDLQMDNTGTTPMPMVFKVDSVEPVDDE